MYKFPKRKARLRDDVCVRFNEAYYRKYQERIKDIGVCQVCDISSNLDTPHHTKQGANKDDRSLICICIECHDILHRVVFSTLHKTRKELESIGEDNWREYKRLLQSIEEK